MEMLNGQWLKPNEKAAYKNAIRLTTKALVRDTKLNISSLIGYKPVNRGRDSSVGIVTRYGLDHSGIESKWGARFSAPVQTGPGAH